MSSINHSTRELSCKIVFYGPALGGKTTNVQYIYENTKSEDRGQMTSLKTATDRTLYFDFLPIKMGTIRGYKVRIHLYTVPGQVYHNVTRKMVLKGVDGVVFVADSAGDRLADNIESIENLKSNLKEEGIDLKDVPYVLQLNKRDLPDILPVTELEHKLRFQDEAVFPACALTGEGIFDTLREIVKLVLEREQKSNFDDTGI